MTPSPRPPPRRPRRRRLRAAALALAFAAGCATGDAAPARVASINMCADQLLLALADPDQIAGLSPFARDPQMSFLANEAARYPLLSGEAEDLLTLAPTLVLAGDYLAPSTRDLLQRQGIAVAEFEAPPTIEAVKDQIRRVGDLVGRPERAAALIATIDASLARAQGAALRSRPTVLSVSRRGWVEGSDSLLSSLLATVGLANAASDLGIASGGFAPLEAIVAARPDFILVAEAAPAAEDQGMALLLHPALERLYPPERRIVIPETLTVCGGPMLPAALDNLARAIDRFRR